MKKIIFDWFWKSNKDNKKVCEAAAIELMTGEPHVCIYDAAHVLLLEVNTKADYSTGFITKATNNSWRRYCNNNPHIFDVVDKKTNIQNSWFNLHKNN